MKQQIFSPKFFLRNYNFKLKQDKIFIPRVIHGFTFERNDRYREGRIIFNILFVNALIRYNVIVLKIICLANIQLSIVIVTFFLCGEVVVHVVLLAENNF